MKWKIMIKSVLFGILFTAGGGASGMIMHRLMEKNLAAFLAILATVVVTCVSIIAYEHFRD
jgi:hypothetical protein